MIRKGDKMTAQGVNWAIGAKPHQMHRPQNNLYKGDYAGGVTINEQYIGANVLHAATEPTTEIKQRSLVGNAGSNPMGTIYGLTSTQQVGETINTHSWVSFVEPMSPGVETYPTLQVGQLENSAYGLISKPLIPGVGITMQDEPGTGIVISATGGGGGGSFPEPLAGDNIRIDWAADRSDFSISWTGMPVYAYGDMSNGDFGAPQGQAKALYFDGFEQQVWPDGTLSVSFAIPCTDEVWDTYAKGFVFDGQDFEITQSQGWPGFLHVKRRTIGGAGLSGIMTIPGDVFVPDSGTNNAVPYIVNANRFRFEDGLLKSVEVADYSSNPKPWDGDNFTQWEQL